MWYSLSSWRKIWFKFYSCFFLISLNIYILIFIIWNANIYKHMESKIDSEINFPLFFIFFQLKIWFIHILESNQFYRFFLKSLSKIEGVYHSFVDSEFSRSNAILDSHEGSFDFYYLQLTGEWRGGRNWQTEVNYIR